MMIAFVIKYLLFPALAAAFLGISILIAPKKQPLNKKKLLFFVLAVAISMSIPSLLAFFSFYFLPGLYIVTFSYYLVIGYFLHRFFNYSFNHSGPLLELLIISAAVLLGAFLYSLTFNFISELDYHFLLLFCTIPVVLPSLFIHTYRALLAIPTEIYTAWHFSTQSDTSWFDERFNELYILEIELYKRPEDQHPLTIKSKAPLNIPFAQWIQRTFEDYNKKFAHTPIQCFDEIGNRYGWIFYTKPSLLKRKKTIDFNKSIQQNRITDTAIIVAKRIIESPIENTLP